METKQAQAWEMEPLAWGLQMGPALWGGYRADVGQGRGGHACRYYFSLLWSLLCLSPTVLGSLSGVNTVEEVCRAGVGVGQG